jgi:hypothetical protein
MPTRVSALLAALFAGLLIAGVAQAAVTPSHLYECRPRPAKAADPPPMPVLPPAVEKIQEKAIAADEFRPVCAAGEVPQPTGTAATPKMRARVSGEAPPRVARRKRARGDRRSSLATASREASGGAWYSWAQGYQLFNGSKGVNALFAVQTNEQPYIPYEESLAGAHSLGQIWGIRETTKGCWSTIETGWMETATYGDVSPHLFIGGFDCGAFMGYAGKAYGMPWVQSSGVVFPNSVLTHNDAFHVYGARMTGNNWWIYYDGQWVGYVPHEAWVSLYPAVLTEIQAGGEVATPNYSTCADMGYAGLFGGNPGAAMFSNVWYEYNYNTQSANANLTSYSSDPSYYATGNWSSPPNHGYAFRYGGPGWC